jgi:hypothetical protein
MTDERIVWVLGAGFSKSLGAPLLRDLFSFESIKDMEVRFKQTDFAKLYGLVAETVIELYHYGRRFADGIPDKFVPGPAMRGVRPPKGERLWEHAEQFLDVLDAAARNPSSAASGRLLEILTKSLPGSAKQLPELSATARRLLAAECSGFMLNRDLTTEEWQPYLRWGRSVVKGQDVVITFNYDAVPETLVADTGVQFMDVLLPGKEPRPTVAPILKLHGSVNWIRKNAAIVAAPDMHASLKCEDQEMIIAAPGPSKAECAGLLEMLWGRADEALTTAAAIVFLGYRFPETDAQARTRLLDAIGRRENGGVVVRTVLGPDKDAAERLASLVEYKLRNKLNRGAVSLTVAREPLRVEDFLSVCSRDAIIERAGTRALVS